MPVKLMIRAAQKYLSAGLSVIPVNPLGHEKPKGPAISEWKTYQKRRPNEREISGWYSNGSKARLAIIGGRVSKGLVIVDVDDVDLAERIRADRDFIRGQRIARTPSGGLHLYLRTPDRVATKPYPHIEGSQGEIRAEGAYVVAPPSPGYKWEQRNPIPRVEDWALWWGGFCERFEIGVGRPNRRRRALPRVIREGRHNLLVREATRLHYKSKAESELKAELARIDQERCRPPLGEKEIRRLVRWTRTLPEKQQFELSDIGNGKRLVARYGEDIRYAPGRGWFIWTGRRWLEDALGQIYEMAKETAGAIEEEGDSDAIVKWSHQSQAMTKLEAMIKSARTEPEIAVSDDQFDSDPWLLNVANGTLDLRTGVIRDPEREDYITRQISVAYEDSDGPAFSRFLRQILPDISTRRFIQRLLGYSITGDVSEQVFPIFYGSGGNGKSTLNNAVLDVLGDYAKQAPSGMFVKKPMGREDETLLSDLQGTRLMFAFETEEEKRLNEALVKQATGGDKIRARRLYQNRFEFTPTHHVVLVTNHLPIIEGGDSGIWRRVLKVPFSVSIPESERDRDLHKKLKEEYPFILKWLVAGCMAWQRGGLGAPEEVKTATQEYRSDSDLIGMFIADNCETGQSKRGRSSTLWNSYKGWCTRMGVNERSQLFLGRRLKELGYVQARDEKGQRVWIGLTARVS